MAVDGVSLVEKEKTITEVLNKCQKCSSGCRELQALAFSKGGFLKDELRRKAWPLLLNVDEASLERDLVDGDAKTCQWSEQVTLDARRTSKRFPPGIDDDTRHRLQGTLVVLICGLLTAHPDLHYYQGFHEVALTVLLVMRHERMAYHVLESLTTRHLTALMTPTIEKTTALLEYIMTTVKQDNPELHMFLLTSDVGTIFSLPWVVTWFSYCLDDYDTIVRVFDAIVASGFQSSPVDQQSHAEGPEVFYPLCLSAHLVLSRAEEAMAMECEMSTQLAFLSKLPERVDDWDEALAGGSDLMKKYWMKSDAELYRKQTLRNSVDMNVVPEAEKVDWSAEKACYVQKTPKRSAPETPRPAGKSRRRSSLKMKWSMSVDGAGNDVPQGPDNQAHWSVSVDDAGNDVPQAPGDQAKSSFSSIVVPEEGVLQACIRRSTSSRSSTSSVKLDATFVVDASPALESDQQEDYHDDVFVEVHKVVSPAMSHASRCRSRNVPIHERPRAEILPVEDGSDSDVADASAQEPVVATANSTRRQTIASFRDLTDTVDLPMRPPARKTITRVEPFRFLTEERAQKRKHADDRSGHCKKRTISVPQGLKGDIISLGFFERQELARKKRQQLQKEEEDRQKKMRQFHAKPIPKSLNLKKRH